MKIKFTCMNCATPRTEAEMLEAVACDRCGTTSFLARKDDAKPKHVFQPGDEIRLPDDHAHWPCQVFTLEKRHVVAGINGWLAIRGKDYGWFLFHATVQASTLISTGKPMPVLHDFRVGEVFDAAPELLGKAFRASVTSIEPDGFYGKTSDGKRVFVSHHAVRHGLVKRPDTICFDEVEPRSCEVVADPVNPDLYLVITGLWG